MKTILLLTILIGKVSLNHAQSYWNLTGNSSTIPGTNFIGTTDNNDVVLKTNNAERLRISLTGRLLTTGSTSSLFIGESVANETSTGIDNIAIGKLALSLNTSGYDNIALGSNSLKINTTGRDNTSVGVSSMYSNTTGIRNVAIGALAAFKVSSGNDNSSLGTLSLYNTTTGSGNTAVGYYALAVNTTGSNNSVFGFGADVSTNNLTNASAFGYNAKVSSSNSLVLGGTGADIVKVGIGVVSPNARLEVNSAAAGESGLRFTQLTSSSSTTSSNGKLLSVDAQGNVISVPENIANGSETKLSAGTNISLSGTGTTVSPYQISATGNFYWVNSAIGTNNIINNNAGSIIIGTGITTAPSGYKLIVSNGILTEKVKVSLKSSANWADHVFGDKYDLPSLNYIEKYIKANNHLPGIPSADELVKEGGIDVGEMFAKQMGKIEELTLYIIELKKESELLKKQIELLQKNN